MRSARDSVDPQALADREDRMCAGKCRDQKEPPGNRY